MSINFSYTAERDKIKYTFSGVSGDNINVEASYDGTNYTKHPFGCLSGQAVSDWFGLPSYQYESRQVTFYIRINDATTVLYSNTYSITIPQWISLPLWSWTQAMPNQSSTVEQRQFFDQHLYMYSPIKEITSQGTTTPNFRASIWNDMVYITKLMKDAVGGWKSTYATYENTRSSTGSRIMGTQFNSLIENIVLGRSNVLQMPWKTTSSFHGYIGRQRVAGAKEINEAIKNQQVKKASLLPTTTAHEVGWSVINIEQTPAVAERIPAGQGGPPINSSTMYNYSGRLYTGTINDKWGTYYIELRYDGSYYWVFYRNGFIGLESTGSGTSKYREGMTTSGTRKYGNLGWFYDKTLEETIYVAARTGYRIDILHTVGTYYVDGWVYVDNQKSARRMYSWYYFKGNGEVDSATMSSVFPGVDVEYGIPDGTFKAKYSNSTGTVHKDATVLHQIYVDENGFYSPNTYPTVKYQYAPTEYSYSYNGWEYIDTTESWRFPWGQRVTPGWYYFDTDGYLSKDMGIGNPAVEMNESRTGGEPQNWYHGIYQKDGNSYLNAHNTGYHNGIIFSESYTETASGQQAITEAHVEQISQTHELGYTSYNFQWSNTFDNANNVSSGILHEDWDNIPAMINRGWFFQVTPGYRVSGGWAYLPTVSSGWRLNTSNSSGLCPYAWFYIKPTVSEENTIHYKYSHYNFYGTLYDYDGAHWWSYEDNKYQTGREWYARVSKCSKRKNLSYDSWKVTWCAGIAFYLENVFQNTDDPRYAIHFPWLGYSLPGNGTEQGRERFESWRTDPPSGLFCDTNFADEIIVDSECQNGHTVLIKKLEDSGYYTVGVGFNWYHCLDFASYGGMVDYDYMARFMGGVDSRSVYGGISDADFRAHITNKTYTAYTIENNVITGTTTTPFDCARSDEYLINKYGFLPKSREPGLSFEEDGEDFFITDPDVIYASYFKYGSTYPITDKLNLMIRSLNDWTNQATVYRSFAVNSAGQLRIDKQIYTYATEGLNGHLSYQLDLETQNPDWVYANESTLFSYYAYLTANVVTISAFEWASLTHTNWFEIYAFQNLYSHLLFSISNYSWMQLGASSVRLLQDILINPFGNLSTSVDIGIGSYSFTVDFLQILNSQSFDVNYAISNISFDILSFLTSSHFTNLYSIFNSAFNNYGFVNTEGFQTFGALEVNLNTLAIFITQPGILTELFEINAGNYGFVNTEDFQTFGALEVNLNDLAIFITQPGILTELFEINAGNYATLSLDVIGGLFINQLFKYDNILNLQSVYRALITIEYPLNFNNTLNLLNGTIIYNTINHLANFDNINNLQNHTIIYNTINNQIQFSNLQNLRNFSQENVSINLFNYFNTSLNLLSFSQGFFVTILSNTINYNLNFYSFGLQALSIVLNYKISHNLNLWSFNRQALYLTLANAFNSQLNLYSFNITNTIINLSTNLNNDINLYSFNINNLLSSIDDNFNHNIKLYNFSISNLDNWLTNNFSSNINLYNFKILSLKTIILLNLNQNLQFQNIGMNTLVFNLALILNNHINFLPASIVSVKAINQNEYSNYLLIQNSRLLSFNINNILLFNHLLDFKNQSLSYYLIKINDLYNLTINFINIGLNNVSINTNIYYSLILNYQNIGLSNIFSICNISYFNNINLTNYTLSWLKSLIITNYIINLNFKNYGLAYYISNNSLIYKPDVQLQNYGLQYYFIKQSNDYYNIIILSSKKLTKYNNNYNLIYSIYNILINKDLIRYSSNYQLGYTNFSILASKELIRYQAGFILNYLVSGILASKELIRYKSGYTIGLNIDADFTEQELIRYKNNFITKFNNRVIASSKVLTHSYTNNNQLFNNIISCSNIIFNHHQNLNYNLFANSMIFGSYILKKCITSAGILLNYDNEIEVTILVDWLYPELIDTGTYWVKQEYKVVQSGSQLTLF